MILLINIKINVNCPMNYMILIIHEIDVLQLHGYVKCKDLI